MTSAFQRTRYYRKNCDNCKHSISSSKRLYCGKLRENAGRTESCPHFEVEPLEYKLYRRM